MPQIKPGAKFHSAACTGQVIVVRGGGDVDLRCGGMPMTDEDAGGGTGSPIGGHDSGVLLGKRYVDDADTIEVLCTKAGDGSLGIGDSPMEMAQAKTLPASD